MDDAPGAASSDALQSAERFENYTETTEGALVSFETIAVPAGGFDCAIGEERPRRVEAGWAGQLSGRRRGRINSGHP